MFHYKSLTVNPIEENTHIIWDDETQECAIIDCGVFYKEEKEQLQQFIENNSLRPTLALQTHCHFDHIFGIQWLFDTFGVRPMMHVAEEQTYYDQPSFTKQFIGYDLGLSCPHPERLLKDGDTISLGNHLIKVIHTPGHTLGGVCYYIEKESILFSGDTLFRGSMGRTDLPGGSMEQELHSIRTRLLTLPQDTLVLSGHGPSTTIANEQL